MSRNPRRFLLVAVLLGASLLLFLILRPAPQAGEEITAPDQRPEPRAEASSPVVPEDRQAVPQPSTSSVEEESKPAPAPLEPVIERPPVGVLEVHVLLEKPGALADVRPLVGGAVRIAPSSKVYRTGAPPQLNPEDVIAELPVGTSGVVRFEDVEPESWYVEARSPNGAVRGVPVQLIAEEGRRVILYFGLGRVHGVVSDPETLQPIARANLSLSLNPTPRGMFHYEGKRELGETGRTPSSLHVTTGSDGVFQFDELPSCEVSLWLDPVVRDPESGAFRLIPRRFVDFELEAGETKRCDFPDLEGAIWTGRVVNRNGDVVRGQDTEAGKLDCRLQKGSMDYRQVQSVELDGSFQVHLPSGVYDVLLFSPFNSEESRPFGEEGLEVQGGSELRRDIVLPGTRLKATVYDAQGQLYTGSLGFPAGAHLEGQTHSSAWHSTVVGPEGTFVLDGIGPGEWVVGAGRRGASTSLTVRESDLELQVEIHLP